jgi:hypothetical protein
LDTIRYPPIQLAVIIPLWASRFSPTQQPTIPLLVQSLYSNTTGYNTAFGNGLFYNTTGTLKQFRFGI